MTLNRPIEQKTAASELQRQQAKAVTQDPEKIARAKLSKYEEILYSPQCNGNDIAEAMPDFMWDKDGKEHLKKHLHYKKLRDKGGETSQDEKGEFTDDKSHTEL